MRHKIAIKFTSAKQNVSQLPILEYIYVIAI